jgi:DNA-binding XRE family transcriptional regulator
MITNERQYRMTKAWIERFEQAMAAEEAPNAAHIPAPIKQAMHEGYQSQLDELRADVADYEALQNGQREPITVRALDALPDALIQARIAARLTQKQLAERLDLKEQQIQRYERTRYARASWTRLLEVASVLGLRLAEPALLEVAPFWPYSDTETPASEIVVAQSQM